MLKDINKLGNKEKTAIQGLILKKTNGSKEILSKINSEITLKKMHGSTEIL